MAFSLGNYGGQLGQPQAAAGIIDPNILQGLNNLHADDFAPIAENTAAEAEKFNKQAATQMEKAKKYQTIGGILNLVGQLSSTANQIYQGSKGRNGIAIGAPLQLAGTAVNDLVAAPAAELQKQYASKAAINQIPGLDPTMRGALLAGVTSGNTGDVFKAFTGAKINERKDEELGLKKEGLQLEKQKAKVDENYKKGLLAKEKPERPDEQFIRLSNHIAQFGIDSLTPGEKELFKAEWAKKQKESRPF